MSYATATPCGKCRKRSGFYKWPSELAIACCRDGPRDRVSENGPKRCGPGPSAFRAWTHRHESQVTTTAAVHLPVANIDELLVGNR